jgi:hypothetical protein
MNFTVVDEITSAELEVINGEYLYMVCSLIYNRKCSSLI